MTLTEQRCYRVFGSASFSGNLAGIHLLAEEATAADLLAHSRAQTSVDNAYLLPEKRPAHFRLRAFSHHGELLICGHALLAAATHLMEKSQRTDLMIHSPGFSHRCTSDGKRVVVSLPSFAHHPDQHPLLQALLMAAGVAPESILRSENGVWIARCAQAGRVQAFHAEAFPWYRLDNLAPGALILTAPLPDGAYMLRYFAPWYGKPEDSATGSAQCYLAALWLSIGQSVTVLQSSPLGQAELQVQRTADGLLLGGRVEGI